jgi:hypothetical protein
MRDSIICILLIILPSIGFSQLDSNKAQSHSLINSGSSENIPINIKGKLYVNGGIGYSLILQRIYSSMANQEAAPYGISESPVYNANIDYGIGKKISIGLGAAYQTATGAPTGTLYFQHSYYTENLTRLNLSVRALREIITKKHFELYYGLRAGISFWTDFVTPIPPPTSTAQPTLGKNHDTYPSIQLPLGIRVFTGHLGVHFEVAIGTPYFAEGGITFRIGKK